MSSKCQQIIDLMEKLAPRNLAEKWDNVGLHIGSPSMNIDKILVCLDVDKDVVHEAINKNVQLIISHHPFLFSPIKSIRWDQYKGELIRQLITNNIAVYCAHTNMDISNKGMNYWLAQKLKLNKIHVLDELFKERMYKFVIYVPKSNIEVLRDELGKLGAGWIGNYSHCTFSSEGVGTFKPLTGANPYIGNINHVEKVEECRLETIVREKDLGRVTRRMLKVHPYEEVAYDIYPLENSGDISGLGIVGETHMESTNDFIAFVKSTLNVNTLKTAGEIPDKIKKVALCTGSGSNLITKAKMAGAQVLITGDIKYHDAQLAYESEIFIIDPGHYASEIIFVDSIISYLNNETTSKKIKVELIPTCANRDYIKFV